MWNDDTQPRGQYDYDRLTTKIFEQFSLNESIKFFGSFGSVGAPGLSDLDLLAVVNDDALLRGFEMPTTDLDSYILTHPPMFIPASLINDIPNYHLIRIEWHTNRPAGSFDYYSAELMNLHVIDKTIYLQSFFWRLFMLKERPVRRSILAITSLARSVEWRERYTSRACPTLSQFKDDALEFRRCWLDNQSDREEMFQELSKLFLRALEISIYLPGMLAEDLGFTSSWNIKEHAVRYRPGTVAIYNNKIAPSELISNIECGKWFRSAKQMLGRYAPIVLGKFVVLEPSAYAYIRHRFDIEMEYQKASGGRVFGAASGRPFANLPPSKVTTAMRDRFASNLRFSNFFSSCELPITNFGNVPTQASSLGFKERLEVTVGNLHLAFKLARRNDFKRFAP